MGREDWYRSTEWSPEIADAFFTKLGRARQKDQYLSIQAMCLAERFPHVALDLLERFYLLPNPYHEAIARRTEAQALVALGRIDDALGAYEKAIAAEEARKGIETEAWLDFSLLVAMTRRRSHYNRALELLVDPRRQVFWPITRFRRMAAAALIEAEVGDPERARRVAKEALAAADEIESGRARHSPPELMGDQYAPVRERLRLIVQAPGNSGDSLFGKLRSRFLQ